MAYERRSEIEEMRLFAKKLAAWLNPIICMAADDLEFGITRHFSNGLISEDEQNQMLRVVERYL
jgi:hypothetical protein